MRLGAVYLLSALLVAGTLVVASPHAHAQELPKKVPLTVAADRLDYDRATDTYVAAGHVRIEQDGVKLEADKVVLNNKTGEASAEGNVYLQDKGDVVRAGELKINLVTREGVIYQGDLFMKKDNYHLKGSLIERKSETVYHVEQGEFTACDEGDWFIRADEMNIDMARYATGRRVSFNMAGIPVFYTPYFLFPVRRQSGFLIPTPGYSSHDGFFMENAFFWAISDYKDMTVSSDYRAKIGHGTGIEYRYNNSQESRGQLYYKFWDIYHTGGSRWEFRFQHQEEFAEDLSARADINLVSDERYYSDLEKDIELRSKPYLDSNAFYVERWNTAALYLLGQYSTDLTQSNDKTIQKLPEVRYTIFEENLAGPLHLNFDGSATNFYKESEDGTRRANFNPELTAAFGSGGLSLTPRAGIRATFYDRSATTSEPTERKYAYAQADLNARISRVYGADGEAGIGRIRHSIEPTISYLYIPHVEQANIPQFDALDSVVSRNTVTVSLINRLTARYKESKDAPAFTTFDMMVFKLSQAYDLNVARDQTSGAHARSDVLGELFVKTPKTFTLSANAGYNSYGRVLSSHSLGAAYTTDRGSLNITEQYLRDPATQFLIGGGSVKLGKWDLGAQWWRDVENKRTTQENYFLHYLSQCWGVRMTYTITPGETRFTAMMDLKGFGSRGDGK
ncbi:MAG TPA: LPS assembly protein LptD [Nitrospirota bacterium]